MSKKRLIACLVVRNGWVVQSLGFKRYLPVGRPEIAARFLDHWGVDEIILVDITASGENRCIDPEMVTRVSESCHVPLAVGGGIRTTAEMRQTLQAGADKICVNSAAIANPRLLSEAALMFGDQCVIASVDVRRTDSGHEVFANGGTSSTGMNPVDWVRELARWGAGEILLNSIDHDGMRCGYNLDLIDAVAPAVDIPVIVMGGAGHPGHIRDVLTRDHVMAAAAANFLHYTEHSVAVIKAFLKTAGLDVRCDSLAGYSRRAFSADTGRLEKLDETELEEMSFKYIQDEVI
jgi:cyclase